MEIPDLYVFHFAIDVGVECVCRAAQAFTPPAPAIVPFAKRSQALLARFADIVSDSNDSADEEANEVGPVDGMEQRRRESDFLSRFADIIDNDEEIDQPPNPDVAQGNDPSDPLARAPGGEEDANRVQGQTSHPHGQLL